MRQFNGGQRCQSKNVVYEFLFAQSDAVHDSIEMIAGRSVANGHVPQGIFDIPGDSEQLPEGKLQKLVQAVLYIPQNHRSPVDGCAYDIGMSSHA